MTLNDFIAKYNEKKVCNGGLCQCVALVRQYLDDVLKFPQFSQVTGAYQIYDIAQNALYEKILNTPQGIPKKGDIMVWKKEYGGYGHTSIIVDANVNAFSSFDQNYTGKAEPCQVINHNYKLVKGWLRPKLSESEDYMLSPDEARQWYREFLGREPDEAYVNGRKAVEFLQGACREHLQRNAQLQNQINDLARQIEEIKNQMPDMSQYISKETHEAIMSKAIITAVESATKDMISKEDCQVKINDAIKDSSEKTGAFEAVISWIKSIWIK